MPGFLTVPLASAHYSVFPAFRPGNTRTVAAETSSNKTGTMSTPMVRIVADVDVHVAVGASPSAGTGDMLIPAGAAEYIALSPDQDEAVAVRRAASASSDGNVWITEAA